MPSEFVPLAERIVDAILDANPATAMFAGDHRVDDRLTDLSPTGVEQQVADCCATPPTRWRRSTRTLSTPRTGRPRDPDRVRRPRPVRADRGARARVEPAAAQPRRAAARADRPADRPDRRAPRAARRPPGRRADAMATARATLVDCPQIHVETAVGQFAGTAALIRSEVPTMLAAVPAMAAEVDAASRRRGGRARRGQRVAARSCRRPTATAAIPRLGRRLWEARLWHTLDTEMSASQVFAAAQDRLVLITEPAAGGGLGVRRRPRKRRDGPARVPAAGRGAGRTTTRSWAWRGSAWPRRPRSSATTSWCRSSTIRATCGRCRSSRAVSRSPTATRPARSRPPTCRRSSASRRRRPTGRPARVASFYREYNDDAVRNLTVHEAMPGHFLQLAHSRRYRGSTRTRALGFSGPFVEGWACYAEEIMADAGFGGLPVRLAQLKMQLRHDPQRDPRPGGALRRHVRGRGDGADARPRLPGGGRGGRQVAPRAAVLDPAVHLLRRIHRGQRDRGGPARPACRRSTGTTGCSRTDRRRRATSEPCWASASPAATDLCRAAYRQTCRVMTSSRFWRPPGARTRPM